MVVLSLVATHMIILLLFPSSWRDISRDIHLTRGLIIHVLFIVFHVVQSYSGIILIRDSMSSDVWVDDPCHLSGIRSIESTSFSHVV